MTRSRYRTIDPWKGTEYPKKVGTVSKLRVRIFDTLEDLHQYAQSPQNSGMACVIHNDLNDQCEILFSKRHIDENTIAHEATHAALWVLKSERKRHQITIGFDEEPIAYLVGSITHQICRFLESIFKEKPTE